MPAQPREHLILIIEDDAAQAENLSVLLSHAFRTEVVGNAESGLIRLKDPSLPSVSGVLLDLHLPNGEGLFLVRLFQREARHVPMVVITGDPGVSSPEELILAGAQDFIMKPVDCWETLTDKLAYAIARHRVRSNYLPLEQGMRDLINRADASCQRLDDALSTRRNAVPTTTVRHPQQEINAR